MSNETFATKKEMWITLAVCFVLAGGAAFGIWKVIAERKEKKAIEAAGVLPRLSKEQDKAIEDMVRQFGRNVLGVTPEQEKAIEAVWNPRPTTLGEVVEAKKKTDALLTPPQRAMVKPFQSMMRNRAVDQIVEPARDYFNPRDFEKFKSEIKRRTANQFGE